MYIGYKNISTKGYPYEVIENVKGRKWKVRFENSGYEAISETKEIQNGHIRDWTEPYVCGIGVVGTELDHPQSHYLYDRWRDMLRRCYDIKNRMFPTYGAIGCYVVDEWHYFPNFVRDMEKKKNIDKIKNKDKEIWQLDKDLICNQKNINPHYYSKETTCIIPRSENIKERNQRQGNPSYISKIRVMQFDTDGNYIKTWDSLTEASQGLGGVDNVGWMSECCQGNGYTYLNYCWIYERDFTSFEEEKLKILKRKANLGKKDIKYRKVIQRFDINNNLLDECLPENLAEKLNINIKAIYRAVQQKHKCKGYILKYKEVV